MLKIALIIIALVLLSAGTFFLVFIRGQSQAPKEVPKNSPVTSQVSEPNEATPSSEIIEALSKPIPSNADAPTKIALLENKIKALEQSNILLSTRVSKLENSTTQTTPTTTSSSSSSSKSPVFIPINSGGTIDSSTTFTNLTSGVAAINPSDYPGYTNMYLIVNLSVSQGQGMAYAQLVNSVSGAAIPSSQVSTNSYSTVSLVSGGFQLPSGANSYTIQLKNLTPGYPAQAAYSFVKVVF